MHRALFSRLVALFVVGVLVTPAIAECAGWAASAVGRHACCAKRAGMASETTMKACCGMSQQSTEAAPGETQITRTSLKLLGAHFISIPASSVSSRTLILGDLPAPRRPAAVPLYLQQASLLI